MQLFCGDCLECFPRLQDNSIDLTVTSPPYDNLRTYNGYTFDWKKTIEQLFRVTKLGGVVVWIVADQTKNGSESGTSFKQALFAMDCGFKLHDTMIWDKAGVTFPHDKLYHNCFEYMFVFAKGKLKTANLLADRKNRFPGNSRIASYREPDGRMLSKRRGPTKEYGRRFNVWHMPQVLSSIERTGHPAQFPIALAKDHILSWSNPGDTVLDPMMGSGTTGVAAIQSGREFVGFEISEKYFKMAKQRIENTFE